jgi:hypothetical protein
MDMKLKKKVIGYLFVAGMIGAMSMTSFANTDVNALSRSARDIETEVESEDEVSSYVTNITRGELISTVEVGIMKDAPGVARISGEMYCHTPMSEITIVLQLQKYNEEKNMWEKVNRQTFEWKASDLPEGETLSMAMISYNIAGLESGGIYRVRAIFDAIDLDGNLNEAWSATSDGITF